MLLEQNVLIKMGGKNIKHYRSLGYNVRLYDEIEVSVHELQRNSHVRVKVSCDYCGNVVEKVYKSLLNEREKTYGNKDCCLNCIKEKTKETMVNLYGVENCMDLSETIEKMRDTFLSNYGVDWNTKDKKIIKKATEAQKNLSEDRKREKREKTRKTLIDRYGVDSPLKLEKTRKRLFETQSIGSSQQILISELLKKEYGEDNVFYNYPVSNLCIDILLKLGGIFIDIEYDSFYWHYPDKDRKRDEYLKSIGYKVLRIKSSKKIPEIYQLNEKIDFLLYTDKMYSEIILDDWNEEEYKKGRSQ